jgi:hypothetical protein
VSGTVQVAPAHEGEQMRALGDVGQDHDQQARGANELQNGTQRSFFGQDGDGPCEQKIKGKQRYERSDQGAVHRRRHAILFIYRLVRIHAGLGESFGQVSCLTLHAMMRLVHSTVGKLFAATLLVLCIGVQVLEASGRWDREIKDTNDEAIIFVVVLCIGAALAAAGARFASVRPSRVISRLVLAGTTPSSWPTLRLALSVSSGSPPRSLRI